MGSFQLFFLFVMGQYVARIYDEARDRPLYVVASRHGFEQVRRIPRPTHQPNMDGVEETEHVG